MFEPHAYQVEAIQHLYRTPRAALWMPMGGGKTVSTLTALENLSLVEDVYPVLVLAPLRVARTTWPDEVAKWRHLRHLRVSVVTGSAEERLAALKAQADIVVLTTDNPRSEEPAAIAAEVERGLRDGAARYEVVLDRRAAIARAVEIAASRARVEARSVDEKSAFYPVLI